MTNRAQASSLIDTFGLNDVQREAVLYNEGPQLVFAGAGTGKTKVLTAKIAFLLSDVGLYPGNIFAATFTNKAAAEMRERVEQMAGITCDGLWIGTFHSLCVRILRREASYLEYDSYFSIYDQTDQLSLIKKVMKELDISERTMAPKSLLNSISRYKNQCKTFKEVEGTASTFYETEIIKAYGLYQQKLKESSAMDFDDLITNAVYLFRNNPQVLESYRRQFRYILVDEYQDTNRSQFLLVKMLAEKSKAIFVVGDDDQSIYSWRGAQIENILSFHKQFEGTKVSKLEQNYRSTPAILDLANAVIESNSGRSDKKLWTSMDRGDDVIVTQYRDDRQEAEKVALKIKKLISEGISASKIAILFRTNAQSRVFEQAFRKQNILYILVGGTSFYDRKEVKDCIAYLRLLVNPKDNVGCDRIINVPARGIGAKSQELLAKNANQNGISTLEAIKKKEFGEVKGKALKGLEELSEMYLLLDSMVEDGMTPQDLLSSILKETGYIDMLQTEDSEEAKGRLENINELMNAVTEWHDENGGDLSSFLEEISLVSDIDGWKQRENAVNMMTLHSAKGLEFDTAFFVGFEDGLIPSRQNFEDRAKIEEECRLAYVGITRAMRRLECSHVETRMRFGQVLPMGPSRFLESVDPSLYRFVDESSVFGSFSSGRNSGSFSGFAEKDSINKPVVRARKRIFPDGRPADRHKKVITAPQFDEFSQVEVQYRMGQMVSHPKFGEGKIMSVSGFGPDMMIAVLFRDGNRKQMMAKFAKLEIL